MTIRSYRTAAAFKQALEQRLRSAGPDLGRQRQLLVFDRFLARVFAELEDAVMLKGGLALELRLSRARTTKDVDLRIVGPPDLTLERLRSAARRDLGDYLDFAVRPHDRHPTIQAEGMKYDGLRFRAECGLAGKIYGRPFGVDVAYGEPVFGEPDVVLAEDSLSFAGIAAPAIRVIPIETHIAEKLHAYTVPRGRPSSRVKDLPDLALIATMASIEAEALRAALAQTFAFRSTHEVPARLPEPPSLWEIPYANLAEADGLEWKTLAEVAAAARAFLDPVLAGAIDARWDPVARAWCAARP